MFRGIVGSQVRENLLRRNRQIVQDNSAAVHQRQRSFRDQEHAGEVRGDDILPRFCWQFGYGLSGVRDAGIVDENVESAESLAHSLEQIGHALLGAYIAGVGKDRNPLALELLLRALKLKRIPAAEDQIAAFIGQGLRNCQPDALSGAGDQRDFSS